MGEARFSRLKPSATLLSLLLATLVFPLAWGDETKLSIRGYDTVAYFTDRKPVQGKAEFEYLWHKLRWRFATAAHLTLFRQDPERYAPQYDGYCAAGVAWSDPHKTPIDPEAWAIVDGKLYFGANRYWLRKFQEKADENIRQADANWPTIVKLPDPVTLGPPCAASPPSSVLTLRGGRRYVLVGGQVARDEAGNVVGKGDMRAQIEEVGKKVGACLKAGGATVKDIIWTVNHITELAQFDKYADLRQLYFGPPSKSETIPVRQLAGPDFLVQVEAVAAIR
jgi:enamine deaminase RidA (YjgF/YER057c/UK114 family)